MSNAKPDFAFLGLLNKFASLILPDQALGLSWGGKFGFGGKFCKSYNA